MGEIPFEIIVVSDVVDYETENVCRKFLTDRDTYVRRGGQPGPSDSRNLGLSIATGNYVLFLDDDDAWHSDLLINLTEGIQTSGFGPFYFNCSIVKESRNSESPEKISEIQLSVEGKLDLDVYVKNQVHMSCFVFPRELLNRLTFDRTMRAYEDWDFLLAVFDRKFPAYLNCLGSQIYEVDDNTTDRRGSSSSANDFNAVLDYLYVYRRHKAPTPALAHKRSELLRSAGLEIPASFL